jgi:hypothetical protein
MLRQRHSHKHRTRGEGNFEFRRWEGATGTRPGQARDIKRRVREARGAEPGEEQHQQVESRWGRSSSGRPTLTKEKWDSGNSQDGVGRPQCLPCACGTPPRGTCAGGRADGRTERQGFGMVEARRGTARLPRPDQARPKHVAVGKSWASTG